MQSLPSCIQSTYLLESLIKTDNGFGPGAMGAMGHAACGTVGCDSVNNA
jgi:hypothetical protein